MKLSLAIVAGVGLLPGLLTSALLLGNKLVDLGMRYFKMGEVSPEIVVTGGKTSMQFVASWPATLCISLGCLLYMIGFAILLSGMVRNSVP